MYSDGLVFELGVDGIFVEMSFYYTWDGEFGTCLGS